MNTSLAIGHRDPRTEIVPSKYLYLAAQLLTTEHQDVDYWNKVPVPQGPTDGLAFEALRQVAVFLPMVLVAFAYSKFSFVGALIAFFVALPVMKGMHESMCRAIMTRREAWRRRDAGRYAFTEYMCKEFDLRPEDVTTKLVLKMSRDFRLWLATAARLRQEASAVERARCPVASSKGVYGKFADSTSTAIGGARAAVGDTELPVMGSDASMTINPTTGLPMVTSMLDIHGNTYGMDNVDALFNDTNYSSSFNNAPFHGGTGLQQDGFNPGINNFGGFDYD